MSPVLHPLYRAGIGLEADGELLRCVDSAWRSEASETAIAGPGNLYAIPPGASDEIDYSFFRLDDGAYRIRLRVHVDDEIVPLELDFESGE